MKQLIFIFILIFESTGFSQQIDSLYIVYDIGYDCSYTLQSETMRGACGNRQKMDYHKRKQAYRRKSFVSEKTFHQWKGKFVSDSIADSITKKYSHWQGGFGSNLIVDSTESISSFKHRKISAKSLDQFLSTICSIQSDTVFSYLINDIPKRFLRNNYITLENYDINQVDSLLQDPFSSMAISTVTGYLRIYFKISGISYGLIRDSQNDYWRLFRNDSNKRYRFIYFAFDTFLLDELPKNFSGFEVLD